MGQRLIISEEERIRINKMYGLVNEQTKLLPTIKNVGVWITEDTKGEPPYKLDLIGTPTNSDNEVAIRGLIAKEPTGGLKNEEAFLKYNCDKKEYTINGIGEYGKHLNATAYLTDKAKEGLKMETWCKTYR